MATNYGHQNAPELKQGVFGMSRNTLKYVMVDSAAIFKGEFVGTKSGLAAGAGFGIAAYADNTLIDGYVVNFMRKDSNTPIVDESAYYKGAVTAATAVAPMKYTANASNDRGNATNYLELVEVMPILPGDILEVTLMNDAGSATVTRGTTTGSDKEGYGLGVEAGAPYGAQESSSSTTLTALDFQIVTIAGNFPTRSDRVYVQCINLGLAHVVAQA